MASSYNRVFRASFRRRAFGWSGTRKAIDLLTEAVSEIEGMARIDPAKAGEGAVLLLDKLSPAVRDIDGSSGALGNATACAVEKLVPIIAAAPVPRFAACSALAWQRARESFSMSRGLEHRPSGRGSAWGSVPHKRWLGNSSKAAARERREVRTWPDR